MKPDNYQRPDHDVLVILFLIASFLMGVLLAAIYILRELTK